MDTDTFANSKIAHFIFRIIAVAMESRFRYRFFGPMPILQGADIQTSDPKPFRGRWGVVQGFTLWRQHT